jgi:hypothetical protein
MFYNFSPTLNSFFLENKGNIIYYKSKLSLTLMVFPEYTFSAKFASGLPLPDSSTKYDTVGSGKDLEKAGKPAKLT